MDTIKLGNPMPKPCKKCGLLYGYYVIDNLRTTYSYSYKANGEMDGGVYSDFPNTTKEGTRAYCSNCGNDLKLKIDRKDATNG